jgi:hypothetical protein
VSDRPPLDGWHSTSFVVTDRGPNSAARWRSSVPLARPLSPPDPNPLSVLRLIRQVLRELRVILCQTLKAEVASNVDIRNFCPIVVTFSTGLFTESTTFNHLDSCFPQPGGRGDLSCDRDSTRSSPTRTRHRGPLTWVETRYPSNSCLNLRRMPELRTPPATRRSVVTRERTPSRVWRPVAARQRDRRMP